MSALRATSVGCGMNDAVLTPWCSVKRGDSVPRSISSLPDSLLIRPRAIPNTEDTLSLLTSTTLEPRNGPMCALAESES